MRPLSWAGDALRSFLARGDEPWIQTYLGSAFQLRSPRTQDVCIADIARALSFICRFNGHCIRYYSVAEHSVLVSRLAASMGVDDVSRLELARWGLLHDAVEAYLGDVTSPLKKLLPGYRALERRVAGVVLPEFGLHGPMPAAIKVADRAMLVREGAALQGPRVKPWPFPTPEHEGLPLQCWGPERAMDEFLAEFWRLFPEHAERPSPIVDDEGCDDA